MIKIIINYIMIRLGVVIIIKMLWEIFGKKMLGSISLENFIFFIIYKRIWTNLITDKWIFWTKCCLFRYLAILRLRWISRYIKFDIWFFIFFFGILLDFGNSLFCY